MVKKTHNYKLKKNIGLFQLTLYGVGIILGAGIYALIGPAAGIAGNAVWMSFILGAILAFFTGMSYAELSSMYPKSAAEYVYTKKAFKEKYLAFIVQWIMLITITLSAATVALGFAGYFADAFGGSIILIAAGLIVVLSLINYIGMKESSEFNMISTIIEAGGLIIIIILGLFFFNRGNIDYFALPPTGMLGIISGTALIFFAYLGFEDLVNVSEETKKAKKVVPKALVLALLISTVIYILVAISAVSIVGVDKLAASNAPLKEVINSTIPDASFAFSIIALFATANTVLVMLIVASRILYGLSRQKLMPRPFSYVGKRGTPYMAAVVIMLLCIFMLLLGGIKTIALLTDVGIFIVYLFINSAVIALRYRQPKLKREFRSPFSIGRLPVLPVLGIITSLMILVFFERELILYETSIIFIGVLVYMIVKAKRRHSRKNRK
ncbi:MAG: amino acid permease [Ignavibacteriae bacterium]|nr:amino acid permease [Ignavibacteriota bacterium]